MSRSGFISLLVIVALCATAGIGSPVGAYEHGSTTGGTVDGTHSAVASADAALNVGSTQQFDRTLFIATVYENGSATWTFRYERSLDGESEVDAFEEFAEEFESEETALYQRVSEQARGLTETGTERTGREMEATNFNRSAGVEHRIRQEGIVEISFLWEGFAEFDEDERTVTVGDAFDGFPLESNQQLIIEAGDGLVFVSAQPDGEYATLSIEDADSITWLGGQEFIAGQPRVVLEHEAEEGLWSPFPTDPAVLVIATLLLASLVLAGAFAWRRTSSTQEPDAAPASDGAAAEPAGDAESVGGTKPGDTTEPLSGDELLTDEDRVVKLIRENGGRMKQVHIVEETGWSKSKVSMLLSEMEAEDTISKLRVGRENIISLDGFEPEAAKSPFEE